jgi:NAD(P)H-nitrite reductase large subunit
MSHGTVIIGNGIAGVTTARHLRKNSRQRIQLISAETPYFFSRTALMYVYMGHMKFEHTQPYENDFWHKNDISLVQAFVKRVDSKTKTVILDNGEEIQFDNLVIATGSKTRFFGWPGQDLKGVQGLYSYQDLMSLEAHTPKPFEKNHRVKQAVIVGAGLIGVELAEMLLTRDIEVTFLVRGKYFWGNILTANEAQQINEHLMRHGVKLLFDKELKEVLGDSQGRVRAVVTDKGEEIECQLLGITTGVEANLSFEIDVDLEINRGILVNEFLETSIEGIYAAGDCAEVRNPGEGRKGIEPVWYVGRMMGEVLGQTLAGTKMPYAPGPWFNSAKFFDIEYQTYGTVLNEHEGRQSQFFWKHLSQDKFITISYHPETEVFEGINAFGVRLRHAYFDKALREKQRVGQVVGGLAAANFDAEFYGKWHKQLQSDFTSQTGIALKKSNILKTLLSR